MHLHPQGRLCHIAEQLSLQDVLSLLVLLSRLERLVILPAYRLVTLSAGNIPHNVSARSHVPLAGIARRDVDDIVEQVRLAMLASEVLIQHVSNGSLAWQEEGVTKSLTYSAYDVFMVREVRLAVLAAVDLVAIQVDVVREPHCPESSADCRRIEV